MKHSACLIQIVLLLNLVLGTHTSNAGQSVSASIKVTAFVVESTGFLPADMIGTEGEISPFDTFLLHRSLTDNQSLQLSWVDPNGGSELVDNQAISPQQLFPSLTRLSLPNEKNTLRVLQIIYTDN